LDTDAELPPSWAPPSSWNIHAGGLPWPEVDGQRDRKKYTSPPAKTLVGFFMRKRENLKGSRNEDEQSTEY
jgi:hypothetical protein